MTIPFLKMHGLGNDFVVLDGRLDPIAVSSGLARALSDRHTGIGCDQLILLGPSDKAALRMDIWNADGSPAESCGNASRCVVALTGAATIDTPGGIVEGSGAGDQFTVAMGEPRFGWDVSPLMASSAPSTASAPASIAASTLAAAMPLVSCV